MAVERTAAAPSAVPLPLDVHADVVELLAQLLAKTYQRDRREAEASR